MEGKAFTVHKVLLVKDSDYFEKALNGPFVEAQTRTINLGDDISSAQFGVYVDVLYRSYVDKGYKFRPGVLDLHKAAFYTEPKQKVGPRSQILWLWRLSDRFLNKRLLEIAEVSFKWFIRNFTVLKWEAMYTGRGHTDHQLLSRITSLQDAYQHCVEHDLPQMDEIVRCTANMPLQLFTKHYDDLDDDFRTVVMKQLMKRFENPNLKRPFEGDDEGTTPAKREKKT